MTTTKAEAIRRLEAEAHVTEPGQEVEIGRLRPEDAPGVARLFFAVYGGDYPVDVPYVPELLARANEDGSMCSTVARTPKGDVVGHVALLRSAAPNPRLFELGQGAVLPSYRGASIQTRLQELVVRTLGPTLPIDGVFGEAVTNRTTTQKLAIGLGFGETGIELDLMAEGSFAREGEPGRVTTVLVTLTYRDLPQDLHVPAPYREALSYALSDLPIVRTLVDSAAPAPAGSRTAVDVAAWPSASVLRANVSSVGEDFPAVAEGLEARAAAEGLRVRQVWLSLREPWAARAVEALRPRGYSLAGLMPRWFESDALVLQRLDHEPEYERVRLFTEKARRLLDLVRRDREEVRALRAG